MKVEYIDKAIRLGEVEKENIGVVISENLDYFIGSYENGVFKSGFQLNSKKDLRFVGHNNNGEHVIGVLNDNAIQYRGQFKNGKFHGLGSLSKQGIGNTRRQYFGEFKFGKKHGLGYEIDWKPVNVVDELLIYYGDPDEVNGYYLYYGQYVNDRKDGLFFKILIHRFGQIELVYFENDKELDSIKINRNSKDADFDFYKSFGLGYSSQSDDKNLYFGPLVNNNICGFGLHYSSEKNEYVIGYFEDDKLVGTYIRDTIRDVYQGSLQHDIVIETFHEPSTQNENCFYSESYNWHRCETVIRSGNLTFKIIDDYERLYLDYYEFDTKIGSFSKVEADDPHELLNSNYYIDGLNEYLKFSNIENTISYGLLDDGNYLSQKINGTVEIVELSQFSQIRIYPDPASYPLPVSKNETTDISDMDYYSIPFKVYINNLYEYRSLDFLKPHYLVLDTETVGLPDESLSDFNIQKWPRLIECAYSVYSKSGLLIRSLSKLIRPSNFIVPENLISNIKHQYLLDHGDDLAEFLHFFNQIIDSSSVIVGHNIHFDINVLLAEYKRSNISTSLGEKGKYCTMYKSMEFLQVSHRLKLSDTYFKLFNENFDSKHRAWSDMEATSRCFWYLKDAEKR